MGSKPTIPPRLKRSISFVKVSWYVPGPCSSINRPAPPTCVRYLLPVRGPANAWCGEYACKDESRTSQLYLNQTKQDRCAKCLG